MNMIRKAVTLALLVILSFTSNAQRLKVSENGRFLVTENGEPFFWMADTAWELFHRTTKEEADMYLAKRAEQGFNVVQAVALAELDGLNTPNVYGEKPLLNNDPRTPNPRYFEYVDYIIQKAAELGIHIALLPTWGDKLFKAGWGVGPEVFNTDNAAAFGRWIGSRYAARDNVIWIIGGDRHPRDNSDDVAVWNAMAEAEAEAAGGYERTLMSYHPQPKVCGGSSTWFHNEPWLDFNMHQTGHCANQGTYKQISHDYALKPVKPVLDAEPLYEDHPNCFNAKDLGHSAAEDIRRIMYWDVFAGGFGQTYGNHDVWQMYKVGREPVNQPLRPWPEALDMPMANQVKHLKNLMLSRPFLSRIPDQSMVVGEQEDDKDYTIATRSSDGSYAMIYFPTGKPATIDLTAIKSAKLKTWWFDPRTGNAFEGHDFVKSANTNVVPPTTGKGHDWVLVVDDASMKFNRPGK
ncbi:MAG: glycoside hydrolase family 140 protein [Roseivirga sp.]